MHPHTDSTPIVATVVTPITDAPSAARAAEVQAAYAAYGPDSLADTAPVTDGRGVEVDDVIELLAELKFLQDLDRLF